MSNGSQKTVLIAGGRFFGTAIAQNLAKSIDTTKHRIIVFTASHKFQHILAVIRTVTTADEGEFKFGEVVSFTVGEGLGSVTLESGEKVDYDVLVLAPGNKWKGALDLPTGAAELQNHIDSWRAKIEKARDIVLVGGGAVGIEFAGEISDLYKGKNVTLVHNDRLPLNDTYSDRFRNNFLNKMSKGGVNVVLEDSATALTPTADGTLALQSGQVVQTDLVIPTFSGSPNTDFIKASLGEDVLVPSRHIKALPTLHIPGYTRAFAAGDIIDRKEQKQAAKAPAHAGVVAKNVLAILNGQEPTALYKGSYELIIVTFGRTQGTSYFGVPWGIIFGGWFSRMLKSADLMIEMKRKELGF